MSDIDGIEILKRKLRTLTKEYGPEAATVCTLTLKAALAQPGVADEGVTLETLAEQMDIDQDILVKVLNLMCNAALLQRYEGAFRVPDWLIEIGRGYDAELNRAIARKVGLDLDGESLTFSSQITLIANLLYGRVQTDPDFVAATIEEKLASITGLILGGVADLKPETAKMLRKVLFTQPAFYRLSNTEKLAVYWTFFGPDGPRYEKEMPGTVAAFFRVAEHEVEPLLAKARQYLEERGLVRYVVELDKEELRNLRGD